MLAGCHRALKQPQVPMESMFSLGVEQRATVLRHMILSYDFTYICLWSYAPRPSNWLQDFGAVYEEGVSNRPSSSSGSRARQFFNAYRGSKIYLDAGRIPGLAFMNNYPYMELKLHELQSLVYSQEQLQFYQEAGIKTVVFMGCERGEIELGMSGDPQVDLKVKMENFFRSDFSRQTISGELLQPTDPNQPPSSSSSSLRSLSVDSAEYSPLLFTIPNTSFSQEPPLIGETLLEETLRASFPLSPPPISSSRQQAFQTLNQIHQFEDATMTRAILAVLSSSSTSSSSQQTAQNLPPIGPMSQRPTAFRRYGGALAPVASTPRKQNMFKRAILYFRNMYAMRKQELQIQAGNPRPTTAQSWQHTIQERRRRQKINDSFQVLRSLLPPGSKKDKASVLSSTTEYLSSLISQVAELRKRNQMLESRLAVQRSEISAAGQVSGGESSSIERVSVETAQVSSSTSEARFLDLTVTVRGECSTLDLVIGALEFLKQQRNLSLLSVESNVGMSEPNIPVHRIMLRLRIEGDEFDESGFQEAVRRAVDDLLH